VHNFEPEKKQLLLWIITQRPWWASCYLKRLFRPDLGAHTTRHRPYTFLTESSEGQTPIAGRLWACLSQPGEVERPGRSEDWVDGGSQETIHRVHELCVEAQTYEAITWYTHVGHLHSLWAFTRAGIFEKIEWKSNGGWIKIYLLFLPEPE